MNRRDLLAALAAASLAPARAFAQAQPKMLRVGWVSVLPRTAPERFVDPETGRLVTVFFNPATGERRYVADDNRETQEGSRGSPATPPYES